MKLLPALLLAVAPLVGTAASVSMLPADPFAALAANTTPHGETHASGSGADARLRIVAPKETSHAWDFQCSAPLSGAVAKGETVRVSFALRGAAAAGDARIVVKLQDKADNGLVREEVRAGTAWKPFSASFTAERDYEDGELKLVFFLGLARQTAELASLAVENLGVLSPGATPPPPPPVPTGAAEALTPPPPEAPIALPPLDEATRAKKRYMILKLDDVVGGSPKDGVHGKVRRVTDFLATLGIPSTLGVIGRSLENPRPEYVEWLRRNAVQNGGPIEFWQHGWEHAMHAEWQGKDYMGEYAVPDYAYQKERFDKAQAVFLEKVGVPLQSFCPPNGKFTDDTLRLLREHPEIRSWLYADPERSGGKYAFRRFCNLEVAVGRVEWNAFTRGYRYHRDRECLVLQGHPILWSDESFAAFQDIVRQLVADGWTFITPTRYLDETGADKALRPPELFPFPMGGDAPNTGVADMSALNGGPIAPDARRVTVNADGHFVDGAGRRIRFLATNFTFSEAFPTHEKADALARRLASLGMNAVRIHHIDKEVAPSGIWKKGTDRRDTFDPDQVDRLLYFIAALAREGIYTDFNLHVSREYWRGADFSADGLADDAERGQLLPKYGKGLDRIFAPYVEMQRDYARRVLLAPNPYRDGIPIAKDPAVFLVEINNENTIFNLDTASLPEYYQAYIRRQWNDWLRARYGTTAALRESWGSEQPLGDDLLAGHSPVVEGPKYLRFLPPEDGAVRAELFAKPDENWQAQLQWRDLTLDDGALYTLSFEARSDVPRTASFTARRQVADWRNCGLSGSAKVGKEWKPFTQTFTAHGTEPGITRLDFPMGGAPLGVLEIRGITLRPGGKTGLLDGESLEDGTVSVANKGLGATARGRDWTCFLCETERAYGAAMRGFLRDILGCGALIFDTQASYGGIHGIYREVQQDVIDMHSYWQHPSFPRRPWDMADWAIGNTPMSFAPDHAANLGRLATYRVFGKPFTVTEYDHPAPNNAACEMFPMVAAFGALQDWDGIFQFDWGSAGHGDNKIGRFFDLQNHAGKLAFLPATAVLFRAGAVAPLHEEFALALPADDLAPDVNLPGDVVWAVRNAGDSLKLPAGGALTHRIGLRFHPLRQKPSPEITAGVPISPLRWDDKTPFHLDVPAAKVLVGRCAGARHEFDGASFDVAANASGFAAFALTAMDGKPLAESRRALLAVAGNVENTGMGWNERRTSVGTNWGSSPTVCEGIAAEVTVKTTATAAKVYTLDGKGARLREVTSRLENGTLTFSTAPECQTLWYEIEAE